MTCSYNKSNPLSFTQVYVVIISDGIEKENDMKCLSNINNDNNKNSFTKIMK